MNNHDEPFFDSTESDIIENTLNDMSEAEKEAFAGGVELAFDYGLVDDVSSFDNQLYHAIIAERRRKKAS